MSLFEAYGRRPTYNRSFNSGRLVIGFIIALFSLISFFSSHEYNPVTGEKQFISLTPKQEIALGLQAVPEMIAQFGGESRDARARRRVEEIGRSVVASSQAGQTDWDFNFHLLADRETINAFALPGGQIFITEALFKELETDGQLAGVLGHEVGHVVARHSAQHIAKQELTQGLTGAVMAASGDYDAGRLAAFVGQMVNMKYGRGDELQSDALGVRFMSEAGYDPRSMLEVMEILAKSGGNAPPEFFSTHPNPDNRLERIRAAIQDVFPQGVPSGLKP